MIEVLAQHPAVQPVGWALLHSLWQGCLVALLLAAVLALLPKNAARGRYAAACGALVLLLALPVVTVLRAPIGAADPVAVDQVGGTSERTADKVGGTFGMAALAAADKVGGTSDAAPFTSASLPVEPLLPWLFAFWLAGVAALGSYHLMGWQRCRALRRRGVRPAPPSWQQTAQRLSRRLGLRQSVELVETTALEVPAVIGWLRPVLLVPAAAFAAMPPQQLAAILAHELAHVRRWDGLVNLLQTAAETLLFFHPAVWWISHQARLEREHCCDDLAVAVCGDRGLYARALAGLEELRSAPAAGGVPALGGAMAADGGSLLGRIRRLAGLPPRRRSQRNRLRAGLMALATVLGVLLSAHLALQAPTADAALGIDEEVPSMGRSDLGEVTKKGWWSSSHQGSQSWLKLFDKLEGKGTQQSMRPLAEGEGPGAAPTWHLERDAGRFDFQITRRGEVHIDGTYTFRPNRAFVQAIGELGYTVGEEEAYRLALLDLRLAFAEALADLGYRELELKHLMALHIHGATPD